MHADIERAPQSGEEPALEPDHEPEPEAAFGSPAPESEPAHRSEMGELIRGYRSVPQTKRPDDVLTAAPAPEPGELTRRQWRTELVISWVILSLGIALLGALGLLDPVMLAIAVVLDVVLLVTVLTVRRTTRA